jgi:hypothetical protein
MHAAYLSHALRQWIVDVVPSEDAKTLIYLRGHSPAHGRRHGFMLKAGTEVPSRLHAVRGLKGVEHIEEGFYTSVVHCSPEHQSMLVREIRDRLQAMGFLTTQEWEERVAAGLPPGDPRPTRHVPYR